ncbi:4'-phosphopantetheinyl transferase superfamily protein [Streptomyces sp. S1]|uniref:4'-phosphopantetheinyl transferase superfamily protein n=1 Tax=Streptomyces sp. S1 TaxID=718288 RepID=UPI003D73A902
MTRTLVGVDLVPLSRVRDLLGPDPGTGSGTGLDSGPGTGSGTGPGPGSGSGPGSGPGFGPDPGSGTESGTGTGTGLRTESGPGSNSATGSAPLLRRFLSVEELAVSRTPDGAPDPSGIAGRLAAKEAVFKLLGSVGKPVPWQGIEVLRGPGGRPGVRLSGRAAELARTAGVGPIDVSISHDAGFAIAVAAATTPYDRPSRWISDSEGNAMSSAGIDKVRDWILGRHPERTELASDVDLIESRLVDSLAFVELVYTIEDAAGVEIDFDNIDIEDFQTLATIEKAFFA